MGIGVSTAGSGCVDTQSDLSRPPNPNDPSPPGNSIGGFTCYRRRKPAGPDRNERG